MITCYHCGNESDEVISYDEKEFCCNGCQSVYEILKTNNLCAFYELNENPGNIIKEQSESKFNFLLDLEIEKEILDFKNEKYSVVTLSIPSIHCYSCLWLLEMFPKIQTGISKSSVNYLNKEMTIHFLNNETNLKEISDKLSKIGYPPVIEKKSDKKHERKKEQQSSLIQLGIAGFCFGNIMFLTFPHYFAVGQGIEERFSNYFGFFNWLLGTVVLVFCSKSYFKSAFTGLKYKKFNIDFPISLGIVSLYLYSSYAVLSGLNSGYFDSLAALIFFLLLGRLFQNKTFDQFNFERDYKSYFPLSVSVLKDERKTTTPLDKVKIGDTIFVYHEEIVPADSILIHPRNAEIDYSFVTGESYPEIIESQQIVKAGGRNKGERLELLVSNLPSQSYLTKLWNQAESMQKTALSQLSDNLGQKFTIRILFIAFAALFFWILKSPDQAVFVFTTVLIVACPCALALAIPITYGNVLRLFSKKGLYLKHANVIEYLSDIKHVIFDKTGTLTIANKTEIKFFGNKLSPEQEIFITALARQSKHPLSIAISNYFQLFNLPKIENFEEFPNKGISAIIEGRSIKLGSASWLRIEESNEIGSKVYCQMDGLNIGFFLIQNQYREDLKVYLKQFENLGIETYILSGDNDSEKTYLSQFFKSDHIRMNQTPFDKKEFLEKFNHSKHKTLMIGDGLNDAGALLAADVGFAVTDNTAYFSPSCDGILESKTLNTLPYFIAFAKKTKLVVYACFGISFLYNAVGLFYAVQGKLSPLITAILMPLSSISVLLLSLGLTQIFYNKSRIKI